MALTYDLTDNRALVKRVINPTEPGVNYCTLDVPARGCEVLEYDYAATTTATASTLGDIKDQVRAIRIWSWDPVTSAVNAVDIARYAYDDQRRLREAWSPRISPALKTTYEYDAAGRVTNMTPPGELPWMLDYGTIGADMNGGSLHRVRRAALAQGSPTTTDGEVAIRMVYQVPPARAGGGPHDLTAAAAATWAQKDIPTDATAVFPAEQDPLVQLATPATPGPDGYGLATVYYLNASGQQVNIATPGGHIDTRQYDYFGNEVWSLNSTNRMIALGTHPQAAEFATQLNLPVASPDRANQLAATRRYSFDGQDLLETFGPVTRAVLDRDLVDPHGILTTLPAGSSVVGRRHAVYAYDEGKPDGAAYHLMTTETTGLDLENWPVDADVRMQQKGYDPVYGSTSGWVLKQPTTVTVDAGPGGLSLTSHTIYDSTGRVVQSRDVEATGTDPRTWQTAYYTAGANAAEPACGNRPEWAGEPCLTKTTGTATGTPAAVPNDIQWRHVTRYNRWNSAEIVVEEYTDVYRTMTTVYDNANRVTSTSFTSGIGAALTTATTSYDPATGDIAQTTAGAASISRDYDLYGRVYRYTDASASITTTEYDRWGRQAKVIDNAGSTTYVYDRTIDPRGVLTSLTDSLAGTFHARYSPDGQLVELRYPGGLTRRDTLDASLTPIQRTYTRDSDGLSVYAQSTVANTFGQKVSDVSTSGSRSYRYDRIGRLTSAADVDATGMCTTRHYTYTNRSNRSLKQTWLAAADGTCRSTGTPDIEEAHSYDSADRLVDPGYSYDAFGRTTALPAGMSIGYYINDLVASQQLGDARQTWTLDPAYRFHTMTAETNVEGTWTSTSVTVNHYGDDSDLPRWTVETGAQSTLTRHVSGPGGDLAATTSATGDVRLQLANLHGDIAITIDAGLTAPESHVYDEFGVPALGQDEPRYGWLGGKQRSNEGLGDLILMGVRLYSPALGRFLQIDPVHGGNDNPYTYATDPVNQIDLDGRMPGWLIDQGMSFLAGFLSNVVCAGTGVGYLVCGAIVGAIIGALTYVAKQLNSRRKVRWAGAGAAAVAGMISGAAGPLGQMFRKRIKAVAQRIVSKMIHVLYSRLVGRRYARLKVFLAMIASVALAATARPVTSRSSRINRNSGGGGGGGRYLVL